MAIWLIATICRQISLDAYGNSKWSKQIAKDVANNVYYESKKAIILCKKHLIQGEGFGTNNWVLRLI